MLLGSSLGEVYSGGVGSLAPAAPLPGQLG